MGGHEGGVKILRVDGIERNNMRETAFRRWLLEEGYAPSTATNYVQNVHTCGRLVGECLKEDYNFYQTESIMELHQVRDRLFANRQFREVNTKCHSQYSNALKRYCEFIESSS